MPLPLLPTPASDPRTRAEEIGQVRASSEAHTHSGSCRRSQWWGWQGRGLRGHCAQGLVQWVGSRGGGALAQVMAGAEGAQSEG